MKRIREQGDDDDGNNVDDADLNRARVKGKMERKTGAERYGVKVYSNRSLIFISLHISLIHLTENFTLVLQPEKNNHFLFSTCRPAYRYHH